MKKFLISTVSGITMIAGAALPAMAAEPQNCWGTVVSQRASHYHDIGQHASSQNEPRVGVGNLAKSFDMSVGELAQFLGTIDDGLGQDPDGVTHCP